MYCTESKSGETTFQEMTETPEQLPVKKNTRTYGSYRLTGADLKAPEGHWRQVLTELPCPWCCSSK